MRIIQTLDDIRRLSEAGVYGEAFTGYLESLLREMHQRLAPDEPLKAFSLKPHGPAIVLEKGDNLKDLSAGGLDREAGGLAGTDPEFVERVNAPGLNICRALVIYNNDYAVTFNVARLFFYYIIIWVKWQIAHFSSDFTSNIRNILGPGWYPLTWRLKMRMHPEGS